LELKKLIENKSAHLGVIGLGYVGLPLLIEFAKAGFRVTGYDIDQVKVDLLKAGKSYIRHIKSDHIVEINRTGRVDYQSDFTDSGKPDVLILALPTPLNKHREPDLSYILDTAHILKTRLRKGQMVILESSTWPGTTAEALAPVLEESGLKSGSDFYTAFSPEREDPNNPDFTINNIPKIVGADTPFEQECAAALYNHITQAVPVSSTRSAESAKLLENIFRSINIALVNEMKMILDRMGIDVWEVIEAAATKPFGFMPFYPGPGLGGHCIPIDPFYLTWKAREFEIPTRFIELAGEINSDMPYWVVSKIADALNDVQKSCNGAKALLVGAAYKKNVDDMRETPALKLMELLEDKGAKVDYYDPFIPNLPVMRKYEFEKKSIDLTAENLKSYDVVVIVTAHDDVDYDFIKQYAKIIVDTRNAYKLNGRLGEGNVFKA